MSNGWTGKRVLVTGATGLIGSWLCKELVARGAQVTALIRDDDPGSELMRTGTVSRVSCVRGALEDSATVERAVNDSETSTVFHLGAQTIVGAAYRSPLATFEANIRGTYNVLEACRRLRNVVTAVVVASSDKAYGDSSVLPYTEDMGLAGRFPYDVSKSCADLISLSYFHTYGLPVAVARCGNVYGGGDLNWSRIVPGTVRSFLRRERPVIRSDGTLLRDYIFVRDVVNAYLRLGESLESPAVSGQAFNFGNESPVSVLEMVSTIQTLMECHDLHPVVLGNAPGEIRTQYLSARKAAETLKWAPAYSLQDGLRETISWYMDYLG